MRHKNADLIHQIAEGSTIQRKSYTGAWVDCERASQVLNLPHNEFRVKPGTENSGMPPGVGVDKDQAEPSNNPEERITWGELRQRAGLPINPPERTQLTVREQFAIAAMQAYISVYWENASDYESAKELTKCLCESCYGLADAMLQAGKA